MKKYTIITILLLIVVFTGCNQSDRNEENLESSNSDDGMVKERITEDQLTSLQVPVLEFIERDKVFGATGCYNKRDEISGLMTMYVMANEDDGVDYEAYKEKIWANVGLEFNIIFELTPFPTVPTSVGVIRAIEYDYTGRKEGYVGTILVVSQSSDFVAAGGEAYYDANRISVYEDALIINNKGDALTFEDLQIGMYVDSYYRGMTLDSYPSIQGTEKLVIHEDFQMPMASDEMSSTLINEIFNNDIVTGPYPIIVEGYSDQFIKDGNRLWIHLDDGGKVFYSDIETLKVPVVFYGSLQIYFENESGDYLEDKIENVMLKVNEGIVFTIEEDLITFEVSIYEDDTLHNVKYNIDEKGHISEAN